MYNKAKRHVLKYCLRDKLCAVLDLELAATYLSTAMSCCIITDVPAGIIYKYVVNSCVSDSQCIETIYTDLNIIQTGSCVLLRNTTGC